MSDPIDPFRYVGYIGLRWRSLAASSAIAVACALVGTLLTPRQYTAVARIVVDPPAGADMRAAMTVSPIYLESLRTYEGFATSASLFQKAATGLGLRRLLGNGPIELLQKRVLRVEIVRNTRILEVGATLPDAKQAQAVARFVSEQTVAMNQAVVAEGARDLVEALSQEERRARARLQEADGAWSRALIQEPVEGLQSDLAAAAGLRADLRQQISNTELEVAAAAERAIRASATVAPGVPEARLRELRRQLSTLDRQQGEQQKVLAQRSADRDRLASERRSDEAALVAMQQRLSEARGESGYRGERLRIIDPAIVPERPSSPNLPLNLAIALFAGLALPLVYFTMEMNYQEHRAGLRRGGLRALAESGR